MNSTNFTYDSNGNLTQDDLYKYKYDAENRLVELRLPNDTLIASYAFDGNSLRVVKVWGADRTFYIYAGTQLISEFEDAASNTYQPGTAPGQAGSDSTATVLYQHADRLTARLTTDNSGNLSNEQAHYPYGEQWYAGGTADPSVLRKFTSYQKEDEAATGKLNYAVYREQSARVGRFLMADPKRGNFRNPQRLNRFAYVTGNPITRTDRLGLSDTDNSDDRVLPYEGPRLGEVLDEFTRNETTPSMTNHSFCIGPFCGFVGVGFGGPGGVGGGGGGGGAPIRPACEPAYRRCMDRVGDVYLQCVNGATRFLELCPLGCAVGCAFLVEAPPAYLACVLECIDGCIAAATALYSGCSATRTAGWAVCRQEYCSCMGYTGREFYRCLIQGP
ncbi:MAG: hypothetical protein HY012_08195 [Acidobacteria bacterium]|nr:hypothetical protein [Acidobacteriota bacterium]